MSRPYADHVEEIERLFDGRKRVMSLCGIEQRSAISNWKTHGIPDSAIVRLTGAAMRDGIKLPEWFWEPDSRRKQASA